MKLLWYLLPCFFVVLHLQATISQTELSSFETIEKQAVTLSLRQAVEAATKHHPSVRASAIDVEVSKISEKAAWAGYLPSINLSTSAYGDRESGTSQLTATLAGRQYLLGGAGPKQQAKQAGIDTKIATINHKSTLQQRRALAEDLFLRVWLKQEEQSILQRQFDASSETLRQAKRKYDTGLITEVEYNTQISETSNAETTLSIHKDQHLSLISELEEVTGLNLSNDRGSFVTLLWNAHIEQEIKPASFYIDQAFNNRLELKVNTATHERALADEEFAKGKLLPTVSAVGSYSCGYSPGSTPADPLVASNGFRKSSFFAGLEASWNIFDRNTSKLEAETARAKALKTSTNREITKKKIANEIKKIHCDLKILQKQAKNLQNQLTTTSSACAQAQQFLNVGLTTEAQLKVTDAQNYTTQFACLNQVVTFQRSLFALHAACGYAEETTPSEILTC